jgi:polyhydroxyalkanoate synthesis regulator phasin
MAARGKPLNAEPERRPDESRGLIEQVVLAGVGWASLTAEAADELADELSRRLGIDPAEMRRTVRDVLTGWRRDFERVGRRRGEALDRAIARAGLVRREEHDDLALRVAQLEHRVKLLESK